MTPQNLEIGRPYWVITYADRLFTIPGLKPLIYIGVDVLEDNDATPGPKYTFQDTVSYFRFGNAAQYKGPIDLAEEGAIVHEFTERELADVTDLPGAIQVLIEANAREQEQ